jgi:hypothetical protein
MSQLQRTSPVVLLAREQEALLNATPGIEVATASKGDWGTYMPVGSVGPSEHAARIVRALQYYAGGPEHLGSSLSKVE